MAFRKRIFILVLAIGITFLAGIVGYEAIEGWNLLDSAYMTVITLATIGYGETHPLSEAGRVFTICLILSGISTVSYAALTLTSLVADGELARYYKRKRMDQTIAKLRGHYIVCGIGKTGEHIIAELLRTGRQVVAIDNQPAHLTIFHSPESLESHYGFKAGGQAYYLEADASHDKTLSEAGIAHAEGVFCVLENDRDNLFVVLTARGLNPKVRIVSKCQEEESTQKFVRAGADRLVSPNHIGGMRMASEMIRPSVVSFLDVMVRDAHGYRFEDIVVAADSPFLGKPVAQTPLGTDAEARVIALSDSKFPDQYQYNPSGDIRLEAGQRWVLLGRSEQVRRLQQIVNQG
jgi:voltage-gated potassium channel